MLKMGTYGFLRFVIPLFPEAAEYWSWLFLFLGVVAVSGKCFGKLKTTAFYKVKHSVSRGIFEINSLMLIK